MKIKYVVKIKQANHESYYDNEKQKRVEYETEEVINGGEYYDIEKLGSLTNNILTGFKETKIEITAVRED